MVWRASLQLAMVVVIALAQTDKYTDENRPYKFGFNIQGHQHRSEEKDENGIIKGEYGFITADGYYRVTVYATDQNGDFKIISMKNYYVGFPPEDPTTTPSPPRSNFVTQVRVEPRVFNNPNRQSQVPPVPVTYNPLLNTATIVPQTTPPTLAGRVGCSNCFVPTTTKAPSIAPQARTNYVSNVAPQARTSYVSNVAPQARTNYVSNAVPQARTNYSPNVAPQVRSNNPPNVAPQARTNYASNVSPLARNNYASNVTPQARNNYASNVSPQGRTNYVSNVTPSYYQTSTAVRNEATPGNTPPRVNYISSVTSTQKPIGGIVNTPIYPLSEYVDKGKEVYTSNVYKPPSKSGRQNVQILENPEITQPRTSATIRPYYGSTSSSKPNIENDAYSYVQQIPRKPSSKKDSTDGTVNPKDVTTTLAPNNYYSTPYIKTTAVNNLQNQQYPGARRIDSNLTKGSKTVYQERDGLPPGVTENDIKDLLYRFNYTVGFHGHHEDGYRNGDKVGDYFVDGRDGIERKVTYIANEFGYQPNITLTDIAQNSERRPKQSTEQDYGLKGYEFKWFYRK